MMYDRDTLQGIKQLKAHHLADLADSYSDNGDAAAFFYHIREAVLEAVDYIDADDWEREMVEDYSGRAAEIADSAPDVYTHTRWLEFAGTQAWNEDVSELGASTEDMTAAAGVALYMIANRVVVALAEQIQDSITDDDNEE